MQNVFVVPAPVARGELPRVVRHPARSFERLPAEGGYWPNDFYTAARLRDGDVVLAEPPGEHKDEPLAEPAATAIPAEKPGRAKHKHEA